MKINEKMQGFMDAVEGRHAAEANFEKAKKALLGEMKKAGIDRMTVKGFKLSTVKPKPRKQSKALSSEPEQQ